mgnify:CR=1 FL=1
MDELIEQMARAMHLSAHPTADPDDTIMMLKGEVPRWKIYEHMARAMLPLAFEAAAKIAEAEPRVWDTNAPDPQHRIASAIRSQAKELG